MGRVWSDDPDLDAWDNELMDHLIETDLWDEVSRLNFRGLFFATIAGAIIWTGVIIGLVHIIRK